MSNYEQNPHQLITSGESEGVIKNIDKLSSDKLVINDQNESTVPSAFLVKSWTFAWRSLGSFH
jgi:hypothetical protein